MSYNGKEPDEKIWDYIKRKAPWVYEAISEIPFVHLALENLFGDPATYWGDDKVDITNKVMIGCLGREIAELRDDLWDIIDPLNEKMEGIEEKYRIVRENEISWHFLAMERDNTIFINGLGDTVRVRMDIAKNITERHSFDGTITEKGGFILYIKGKKTLAKIPKSLMTLLSDGNIELPMLE